MAMKYLCVYHDYYEKLEGLSDAQVGRIFRAALNYSATGGITPLGSLESLIFSFLKSDIDRMKESYEKRCAVNRANASRRRRSDANAGESTQEEEKDEGEYNDECEDEEKGEHEHYEKEKEVSCAPARPTVLEVLAYKKEIGSDSSAAAFFDYYEANGWMMSRGRPVADWRAAFRMWERREE